jgi:hypothetical protein
LCWSFRADFEQWKCEMDVYSHLSVTDRVHRMIADAKTQFGCDLRINQSNRTAVQAQQFHICHMFLYNFFKHLKPKHVAQNGKTIDWTRLSDPNVVWALIPLPEQVFLSTKANKPALKRLINGRYAWVDGQEPDKAATTAAMTHFLQAAHVSSMAAPGRDGCGEPCECGGHASKHITGLACDVGGMELLGQKILAKDKSYKSSDEGVDHFLTHYELWRPLAHLPGKAREAWHLEATPHNHKRHARTGHHASHFHHTLNHERALHRHGC